jgi:hypothetical protein
MTGPVIDEATSLSASDGRAASTYAARPAGNGQFPAVPDYYAVRGQQPTMEGGVIAGRDG